MINKFDCDSRNRNTHILDDGREQTISLELFIFIAFERIQMIDRPK